MGDHGQARRAADLSRRVAHVTHALIVASQELKMPVTAGEVMVYDGESLTIMSTTAALTHARRLGLAVYSGRYGKGRYWIPSFTALDLARQLEDRYLNDTDT